MSSGPRACWRKLAWFAGLWAAGVLAVLALGWLIRALMPAW